MPEDQHEGERAAEASQTRPLAQSPMTWDEIVAAARALPDPEDLTEDDVPAVAHLAALLGIFGAPPVDLEALMAESRQRKAQAEQDGRSGENDL